MYDFLVKNNNIMFTTFRISDAEYVEITFINKQQENI